MYIIKNALRSISRSKVRNILIGIISVVIAASACVALSIKESAVKAKEDTLSDMSVTAQIAYDRTAAMESFTENNSDSGEKTFDRTSMKDMMSNISNSLTLDEYMNYTDVLSDNDSYYYTMTASLNAGGEITPYENSNSDTTDESTDTTTSATQDTGNSDSNRPADMPSDKGGDMGGKMSMFTAKGDFVLEGFSSDEALMTLFGSDGTYSITEGSMFEEGTEDMTCIISDELAIWNDNLQVGDEITLTNPSNEDETYTLTIAGIYTNSESGSETTQFFDKTDSANYIYISSAALDKILEESESNKITTEDSRGNEKDSTLTSELNFVYVLTDVDDYNTFADKVTEMGLPDGYVISSTDIENFENSMVPLENLSSMVNWFLWVVFGVGVIILIVLNAFNIRERKYEIGVLTAIGMKKVKVASQFVCELLTVTFIAIIIGAAAGACVSVPVTNKLLENQIESKNESQQNVSSNFGRDANMGGPGQMGTNFGNQTMTKPDNTNSSGKGFQGAVNNISKGTTEYISEVSNSTDLKVIGELILAGILLTLLSSSVAVVTIMRYEPLKILSNRG